MKKNLMLAMAIIMFASILLTKGNKKGKMSDIALANVEALAGDELGANGCYATICYKKCKKYIYESTNPCLCNLCTGK